MSHDDPELWLAHLHCSVRSESRCIIGAPRPPIAQRATDTKPSVVLLSPRSHRPQVEETSHPRSRSALSSCFPLFLRNGFILLTGSSFRCRTLWGSSRISRTQHWKLLKLSQSLYHIIIQLPFSRKCLTRKWRDARASLVSKCSDPAPPRSRRGLELPPKISSFRGISYS